MTHEFNYCGYDEEYVDLIQVFFERAGLVVYRDEDKMLMEVSTLDSEDSWLIEAAAKYNLF